MTTSTIDTITFANGSATSGTFDLGERVAFALGLPAAFTGTTITFLASPTGGAGSFVSVYDDAGTEVSVTVAAARVVSIDAAAGKLAALRYVQLRSGTTASPVTQAAARAVTLYAKR